MISPVVSNSVTTCQEVLMHAGTIYEAITYAGSLPIPTTSVPGVKARGALMTWSSPASIKATVTDGSSAIRDANVAPMIGTG